jgi:hypothetical protein
VERGRLRFTIVLLSSICTPLERGGGAKGQDRQLCTIIVSEPR